MPAQKGGYFFYPASSSIQQLSKALSQRMEVGYSNAERLLRTELNAVLNKSSADAMADAEFTHYQFMATLDRRTCARCGERDGEIFALKDMNQGENAPPLHPRCRCTIVATFDTPKSRSKPVGERSARETGDKRDRAPADMTYRDWKAIYIDKSKTLADWRSAKDAKYRADSLTSTVARSNVGLAAGNINLTSTQGSPPKLIGKLESVTASAIQKTLEHYEAQIVHAPIEHAIIITKTGEIYHCTGDLDALTTIEALGEELYDSHVTHNHPVGSVNEYSFSEADCLLFIRFKLARLRGIDERFVYELNRNSDDVDDIVTLENVNEYTFRHGQVVDFAETKRFGYRRQLR